MTASSAPESVEGEDDDVALVVSNPWLWIKLWLVCPLLSMTLLPSRVRCPLLRSLHGTILHLCSRCRLCLSHIVRCSVSFPRLLRLCVLFHQAWGVGGGGVRCIWVTFRGPCALQFLLFAGCDPLHFIIWSFAFYTMLPPTNRCCSTVLVWRIAGLHPPSPVISA